MVQSAIKQNDTIVTITHPEYSLFSPEWRKWRLTYEGGQKFIDTYLHYYTHRESAPDFNSRKQLAYNPAFAKGAINDIKDSIYSRMKDINRVNGPESYKIALKGEEGGVDLNGSSMNTYIGQKVIPELLIMAKVGVYIDKNQLNGPTIADNFQNRPYIYLYKAEDIRSWRFDTRNQLVALLLLDHMDAIDEATGLPSGTYERYRFLYVDDLDKLVHIKFYDHEGKQTDAYGTYSSEEIVLSLKEIPFAIAGLSCSLLADIADYQIGLLNLASANLSYALKSNFPFYTEQFDPKSENPYLKQGFTGEGTNANGTSQQTPPVREQEIMVGATSGRKYPLGTERPGFIHPSAEPLKAAMDLQTQMKQELRQLLNLTLSALEPKFASAESKDRDTRGLESGLSYIGLELENLERKIAYFWALYEASKPATINYPEKYSLKNAKDIEDESKSLTVLKDSIPSIKAKKAIIKKVVDLNLGRDVSPEEMNEIKTEIDRADYLDSTAINVQKDVDAGIVDLVTAANARGYDGKKIIPIAKEEHANKLAKIAASQQKARGLPGNLSSNPNQPVEDKTQGPPRGQGQ